MPSTPPPPAPPPDRDQILAKAGASGELYHLVRGAIDDLDGAAPWASLYYPPSDATEFLAMVSALIEVIDSLPRRIEDLAAKLLGVDDGSLLDDVEFFFESIQKMAEPEVEKLRSRIATSRNDDRLLTADERAFTCELTADLKGKYASAMMGAAAGLIAGARWNGVEIEPILFPEKAEEFERNRQLVVTLEEVLESIRRLEAEVSLAELVESWRAGQRIDPYALTPFYSFLGSLGRLMQESSRRALYSGDYHQIQKRERLLDAKINELSRLHSQLHEGTAEGAAHHVRMVRRAVEIGAVLDLDVLKAIVGKEVVRELLAAVVAEHEQRQAGKAPTAREKLSNELHHLVPLLEDEDLKTFLELLLGSVMKRNSLSVSGSPPAAPAGAVDEDPWSLFESWPDGGEAEPTRVRPPEDAAVAVPDSPSASPADAEEAAPAPAPVAPPEPLADHTWDVDDGDLLPPLPPLPPVLADADDGPVEVPLEALPEPTSAPLPAALPSPEPDMTDDRRAHLGTLLELLRRLRSPSNRRRRPFDFLRKLLARKKNIPVGMLASIDGFLDDLTEELMPRLRRAAAAGDLSVALADELEEHCRVLRRIGRDDGGVLNRLPLPLLEIDQLLGELNEQVGAEVEAMVAEAEAGSALEEPGAAEAR